MCVPFFETGDFVIVFITLDDRMGVLFNNRRLSRDEEVCRKVAAISEGKRLLMNCYSVKLFQAFENNITVSESFMDEAGEGDFCFAENVKLLPYMDKIEKLIAFKWNRHYPSDTKTDIDFSTWNLKETVEFAGKSHEKITMEVYVR